MLSVVPDKEITQGNGGFQQRTGHRIGGRPSHIQTTLTSRRVRGTIVAQIAIGFCRTCCRLKNEPDIASFPVILMEKPKERFVNYVPPCSSSGEQRCRRGPPSQSELGHLVKASRLAWG